MYKDMTEIMSDGKVGDFELTHFEIDKWAFVAMYCMGILPR